MESQSPAGKLRYPLTLDPPHPLFHSRGKTHDQSTQYEPDNKLPVSKKNENNVTPVTRLPVDVEMPKMSQWKFRVRFVPVPIEEGETWRRYNDEMETRHLQEVDEAVAAFQSFTDKPQVPVHYRPEYDPRMGEGYALNQFYRYANKRNMEYYSSGKQSDTKHKGKAFTSDFHDSMNFVATHYGYRSYNERQKKSGVDKTAGSKDLKLDLKTRSDPGQREKMTMKDSDRHKMEPQSDRSPLKVKFRATPAYW